MSTLLPEEDLPRSHFVNEIQLKRNVVRAHRERLASLVEHLDV